MITFQANVRLIPSESFWFSKNKQKVERFDGPVKVVRGIHLYCIDDVFVDTDIPRHFDGFLKTNKLTKKDMRNDLF